MSKMGDITTKRRYFAEGRHHRRCQKRKCCRGRGVAMSPFWHCGGGLLWKKFINEKLQDLESQHQKVRCCRGGHHGRCLKGHIAEGG